MLSTGPGSHQRCHHWCIFMLALYMLELCRLLLLLSRIFIVCCSLPVLCCAVLCRSALSCGCTPSCKSCRSCTSFLIAPQQSNPDGCFSAHALHALCRHLLAAWASDGCTLQASC